MKTKTLEAGVRQARSANRRHRPVTSKGGSRSGRRLTEKAPAGAKRQASASSRSHATGILARRSKEPGEAPTQALRRLWTSERNHYGVGVFLAVGERQGAEGHLVTIQLTKFRSRPGERPKTDFLAEVDPVRLARLLGGLGHPDRVRLASAILIGARTHRDLSSATGLKTGPLYHHIRELERAGLLASNSRNVHELTELGRIVLLIATAVGSAETPGFGAGRAIRLAPGRVARSA